MYSTQCRVRRGLKTIGKDRGITKAAGRRKSQGAQCEREYHPISSIEARGCVIKINIIISKMVYTTSKTKMTIYYLKLGAMEESHIYVNPFLWRIRRIYICHGPDPTKIWYKYIENANHRKTEMENKTTLKAFSWTCWTRILIDKFADTFIATGPHLMKYGIGTFQRRGVFTQTSFVTQASEKIAQFIICHQKLPDYW